MRRLTSLQLASMCKRALPAHYRLEWWHESAREWCVRISDERQADNGVLEMPFAGRGDGETMREAFIQALQDFERFRPVGERSKVKEIIKLCEAC